MKLYPRLKGSSNKLTQSGVCSLSLSLCMDSLPTVKAYNHRLSIVQFAYIDGHFKQTRPVHCWSQGTDQQGDRLLTLQTNLNYCLER
jgi:hypothetical protein